MPKKDRGKTLNHENCCGAQLCLDALVTVPPCTAVRAEGTNHVPSWALQHGYAALLHGRAFFHVSSVGSQASLDL